MEVLNVPAQVECNEDAVLETFRALDPDGEGLEIRKLGMIMRILGCGNLFFVMGSEINPGRMAYPIFKKFQNVKYEKKYRQCDYN